MTTSINYQHPGQRSEIGKWNDRAYEASREALQKYLETPRLAEAFRRLYEQQMDVGFIQDDLTQVERFQCRSDDGDDRVTFIGQFNPRRRERSKGAGRKTPPRGAQTVETTDPSCFLCTDNICWQHRGVQLYYQFPINGRVYNALCNPFPFMPVHITVARQAHNPQSWQKLGPSEEEQYESRSPRMPRNEWKIAQIVTDLFEITRRLNEDNARSSRRFVGFYNGVGAGASIEKHFHYQFFEVSRGHDLFPLERAAQMPDDEIAPGVLKIGGKDYPLTAFKMTGAQVVAHTVRLAGTWDAHLGQAASANVIVTFEDGAEVVYLVPRNSLYTRSPGLFGTVGVMETLGEFIFCTELEDQLIKEQKINFLHMWRVLESVHPPQCADVDWAAALEESGK